MESVLRLIRAVLAAKGGPTQYSEGGFSVMAENNNINLINLFHFDSGGTLLLLQ